MAERNRFLDVIMPKMGSGASFDGVKPVPKIESTEGAVTDEGMAASIPSPGRSKEDYSVNVVNPPEAPFPGRVK